MENEEIAENEETGENGKKYIEGRNIDKYKRKIRSECRKAGTYQKTDELAISNLAEVLEKRDEAQRDFADSGGCVTIRVDTRGGTTMRKNPALQAWVDLTTCALQYLRELGLTPSARKKITGDGSANKKGNPLADLLKGV